MTTRVVLILAHAGVTQPRVWERWESTGEVRVVVHCPPTIRCGFCSSRRLPIDFKHTRWGEVSIVSETLRAMRAVLELMGPRDFMLFMASGHCIPVKPASELQTVDGDRFGNEVNCSTARSTASQWWALSGTNCERLVRHYDAPGVMADTAISVAMTGLCPDNIMFHTVLPEVVRNAPITFDAHNDMKHLYGCIFITRLEYFVVVCVDGIDIWASPILWSHLDDALECTRISEILKSEDVVWTLRKVLKTLRHSDGFLFMRKVSRRVRFSDDMLDAMFGDAPFPESVGTSFVFDKDFTTEMMARLEMLRQFNRGPMPRAMRFYMTPLMFTPFKIVFKMLGCDKRNFVYFLFALMIASKVVVILIIPPAFGFMLIGSVFFAELWLMRTLVISAAV